MRNIFFTILQNSQESKISGIELLEKVNNFYNSAWDKLIIIGTISFGIIGIVIPLLIQWYQKKVLKLSEERLTKEIEKKTAIMQKQFKKTIQEEIENRINEYEQKIETLNASSNAKAFHIQANGNLEKQYFSDALVDYIIASDDYSKSEDYGNLQTTLRLICDECIPKLSTEEINDIKISENQDLNKLLETLTENDKNGILTKQIRQIKLKLTKIPSKKEVKDKK